MTDCVSGFEQLGVDCNNDPLAVWKKIAPSYPTIARMARDILSIPAASVGVERTFSIARHQLRYNRQYSPQMFETMMMVRHALDSQKTAEERKKAEGLLLSGIADITDDAAMVEYAETQAEAEAIIGLDEISEDEEDGEEQYGAEEEDGAEEDGTEGGGQ